MTKISIYPGTFDPITYGHIDVIKKGLKLFNKIIGAVSDVDNKISSVSLTTNEDEILPFLGELIIPIIPFPPLFVTL